MRSTFGIAYGTALSPTSVFSGLDSKQEDFDKQKQHVRDDPPRHGNRLLGGVHTMMSFMSRKKKYKFHVTFDLEELSSVPFVSGILFAKIRLLDGGNYTANSDRKEVHNNCVKWDYKLTFDCKMSASANTGILDPCLCRVSVRRELKGGRTYQKLGFADINLAEFAGSGAQNRRFLLEGYDSKHRQDNSTLKVTMNVSLLSGDPVFKAMTQSSFLIPGEAEEGCDSRVAPPEDSASMASNSSGFGSLPRKDRPSVVSQEVGIDGDKDFEKGHSRNGSYASQHSRNGSGYGSLTHSRQNSTGTNQGTNQAQQDKLDTILTHTRSPSTGSSLTEFSKSERRRKFEESSFKERRVDQTRVDAEGLVEELLASTDLKPIEQDEFSGLQLLVGKDGTMALR